MTEKEKVERGLLYNPNYDEELIRERIQAKMLCHKYNQLEPSQLEKRRGILQKLFKKMGENILIEPSFYCDYGYHIQVGNNFYSNHNLVILDAAEVEIGDNVFIGPNCGIYTAGHPTDIEQRNKGIEYAKPIKIGNNVWVGGNVVILPGVTIADNVTIGAGSIVTKDIPFNTIAYGNPCKAVKNIE